LYVDSAISGAGIITSVSGTNHISTTTVGGAVTVTSDGTSANTASTLVARNASGNFITSGMYADYIYGGSTGTGNLTISGSGFEVTTNSGGQIFTQDSAGFEFTSAGGIWYLENDGTTQFPNYKFPAADGTYSVANAAGQVLTTNGAGLLAWSTVNNLVPTYTTAVSAATGGVDVKLNSVQNATITTVGTTTIKGGTNVSVTNAGNIITIAAPDTNTTYTYTASSATGGANLNLVGSDATTNTIKLTNAGHITAVYTSPTAVTLGSDATDANTASTIVSRDASGNFSAGTITAALTGNATTATTASKVANALTAGTHLSGGPFDGSSAVTLTTDATTTATASVLVARDANANIFNNATFNGFTSVAASGSTITLTAASTPDYLITGSGGQVIQLPNATTLPNGAIFTFNNNQSSGAITVNNNSASLIVSVPSGGLVNVTLLSNATAAGSWDIHTQAPSNVSWSTNTLSYPGSITSATWNGSTVAVNRGGTGQSTYTDGQLLIGNSTGNTLTKASLTAGTHVVVTPGSGSITLSTDATDANTASTIVSRDASGNFTANVINMGDASRVAGGLQATTNMAYTFLGPNLNTISNNNGLDVASSFTNTVLGNQAQQQLAGYVGDTFAAATPPQLSLRAALGNSVSSGTVPFTGNTASGPSAVASATVLGNVNFAGYGTTGFVDYVGSQGQGGGLNNIAPLAIQGVATEAFADGTLTISGATITAVSRTSVALASVAVTGTKGQISFTSSSIAVGYAVAVTGTLSGTATGISAGTYYVAVTNGTTTATLSATPGGGPITTTAGTTTGLTFTRQTITAQYSAQSYLPFGLQAKVTIANFTNVTSGTYICVGTSTTTSVIIGAPSSAGPTLPGTQSISCPTVTAAGSQLRVRAQPAAIPFNSGNRVDIITHSPASATYRSDAWTFTTGAYGATGTTIMTMNNTAIVASVPVQFPVYTIAGKPASGVVGQQISISNSTTVGGRMAFWDTTNTRWSYVSDNSAV
jgi:hypothetical protein